ncbi:dermonecrotic toxin domain-containing protein [Pseudomonas synxantha]|nr:DUF6543 domain-containing protein [Pseudomonas synxantha]
MNTKVGNNKKTLTPDGASAEYFNGPLLKNNEFESSAVENYKPVLTPDQHTSMHVKAQIKKQWGIDVDPEKTYLVTIAYSPHEIPLRGVIVQKISLAEAARLNIQGLPSLNRVSKQMGKDPEGPPPTIVIQPNSRHTERPGPNGTFPVPDVAETFGKTYQAIYTEPSPDTPNTYSASNQVPIPAASFQQMVWDHAYKKPYDNYLNFYWSHNNTRESYTKLSKISYIKAAHKQHHEQSLDEDGRKIAMRLGGIPEDQTYLDASASELNKPYVPDPNLETKFLTFRGFSSIDIFYTRDIRTNKTLLYIPGNSSPIHSFDSPEAMNEWLAEQLKDDQKAEVFKKHFSAAHYGSSLFSPGFDKQFEIVRELIKNPENEQFNKKHGYWKEGGIFGGEKVKGDPFKELQQRTETAMKESTNSQFVLNSDHTKNHILKAAAMLDIMLLFAAPIGIALPPVGFLLTGLSVGSGLLKLGVGIDDKVNNRPGADDRIVFGVFNAVKPIFTAGLSNAMKPVAEPIKTILKHVMLK